jgi:hypothetical protein
VELVAPSALLLRVDSVMRRRPGRDDRAARLDRVGRPRGPALPALQGDGHPGDGAPGAPLARRLRRVPAHDERLRPASAAPRVDSRGRPGNGGRLRHADRVGAS